MKIFEVLQPLAEGGQSGGARYNSEVALLLVLTGGNAENFNPANPEQSIPADKLSNPAVVYDGIKKFLVDNYDPRIFQRWLGLGQTYAQAIQAKLGAMPEKFSWVGGVNKADNAADIGFVGHDVAGVSVKDEGGITLSNLSPKYFEMGKGDVIASHAKPEFDHLKRVVFDQVLSIAEAAPDQKLSWHSSQSYWISYSSETQKFTIYGKGGGSGKQVELTRSEVMSQLGKNAPWHRPFGDWAVANWSNQVVQDAAQPLIIKVSADFEHLIEVALQQSDKLSKTLAFANNEYFYATTSALYYVPTVETLNELKLKRVRFAKPDGWTLKFFAEIGRRDSEENAAIEIHIRYANGMFASNPTVRGQGLTNPQFISWEKLV